MSETSQGEGWWLASDGKWYSPESRPGPPVTPGANEPGVERPSAGVSEDEASPSPMKRRPSRRMLLVLAAVVLLVAVGVAALAGGADKREIEGMFTLFDPAEIDGDPLDCSGDGGYSDISAGNPVTVRDDDGKIVGGGSTRHATDQTELVERMVLHGGADNEAQAKEYVETLDGSICALLFEVEVDDADFYEVEVGRRGKLAYRRAELEDRDWRVTFTLGD